MCIVLTHHSILSALQAAGLDAAAQASTSSESRKAKKLKKQATAKVKPAEGGNPGAHTDSSLQVPGTQPAACKSETQPEVDASGTQPTAGKCKTQPVADERAPQSAAAECKTQSAAAGPVTQSAAAQCKTQSAAGVSKTQPLAAASQGKPPLTIQHTVCIDVYKLALCADVCNVIGVPESPAETTMQAMFLSIPSALSALATVRRHFYVKHASAACVVMSLLRPVWLAMTPAPAAHLAVMCAASLPQHTTKEHDMCY